MASIVKNHYIDASQLSSKKEYSVGSNGVGNQQEINVLRIALKKTPFLPQEGRLLHARRACSATLKSMDYMQGERKMLTREEVGRGDLPQPLRRRGAPSC